MENQMEQNMEHENRHVAYVAVHGIKVFVVV